MTQFILKDLQLILIPPIQLIIIIDVPTHSAADTYSNAKIPICKICDINRYNIANDINSDTSFRYKGEIVDGVVGPIIPNAPSDILCSFDSNTFDLSNIGVDNIVQINADNTYDTVSDISSIIEYSDGIQKLVCNSSEYYTKKCPSGDNTCEDVELIITENQETELKINCFKPLCMPCTDGEYYTCKQDEGNHNINASLNTTNFQKILKVFIILP